MEEAFIKFNHGLDWFFQFFWIPVFVILAINNVMLATVDYSTSYIIIYGGGAAICVIFAVLGLSSLFRKLNDEINDRGLLSFFTAESAPHRILSGHKDNFPLITVPMRIGVHVVLAIIIGSAAFVSQGAISGWDVPNPWTVDKLSISAGERVMYQGLNPAIIEDYLFGVTLNNMLIAIFTLFFWIVLGINLKENWLRFSFLVLFTSAISSIGLGVLVFGFSSAHTGIAGMNVAFLFFTFMFQTMQGFLYQITGFFLPIAHFTNNMVIAISMSIGISLAGGFLCSVIIPRKKLVPKQAYFHLIWYRLNNKKVVLHG